MLAQGCLLNTSPPIYFNNSSNGSGSSSGSQLSFVPNREAYRLNPYQMTTEALSAFAKCADVAPLAELLLEHRYYSNAGDLSVLCDMVAAITQCCAAEVPAHILPCTSYLTAPLRSTHQRHRKYFMHYVIQKRIGITPVKKILSLIDIDIRMIDKITEMIIVCLGLVALAFYAQLVHQRATGSDTAQLDNIIKGLTCFLLTILQDSAGFFFLCLSFLRIFGTSSRFCF